MEIIETQMALLKRACQQMEKYNGKDKNLFIFWTNAAIGLCDRLDISVEAIRA